MPWCAWKSFGGKLTSSPTAVVKADHRIEVFARGSDGHVWHIWQHEPMGSWSEWSMLGASGGHPPGGTSRIECAQNKDGRMQAFLVGADNMLYSAWQEEKDGRWTS